MALKIHGLSLSSIPLPQVLKPHRLTILFGAIFLAGIVGLLAARSLINRAHVRSVKTLCEQGNQNYRSKKYAEAIQYYEEALRLSPNANLRKEIEAGLAQSRFYNFIHLGSQNHQKGHYDEALKNFKAALDHHPTDVKILTEIHSRIGALHLEKQNYQLAKESYKKALEYTPTDSTIQESLADIEKSLKPKPEPSIPAKTTLNSEPKEPKSLAQKYYEQGLQKLENIDQAIADFSAAQLLDPDDKLKGQIFYQLAACYRKKQQYNQAFLFIMGGLSCTSDQKLFAMLSLEKGFLQDIHLHDLKAAIVSYQVVIELTHDKGIAYDPKLQAIALFLKGSALFRLEFIGKDHRSREALHNTLLALDYARKIEPQDNQLLIELHYQRGICYHELEQFDTAINGYEDALKLVKNPYTKASILCDLALCYREAGRTSEALEPYNQALKCEFTDENLEEKLEFLGGVPLKTLKRGVSASLKNSAELKSMIEASKISIGKITGVD